MRGETDHLPLSGYRVLELAHLINRFADLADDPQVRASGMIVEEVHPRAGRIRTPDTPIRFGRTPGGIRNSAPALGERTEATLSEAGVDPDEIARLRGLEVI